MIVPNKYLDEWIKVCQTPVIGLVGHKRRFAGGPAHPKGKAPAWVTDKGVNMQELYLAHCNVRCFDFRGEMVECR